MTLCKPQADSPTAVFIFIFVFNPQGNPEKFEMKAWMQALKTTRNSACKKIRIAKNVG